MQSGSRQITMRSLRRIAGIAQALLIIGLPFIKIHGQSALRFDVPALQLHVFGCTIWMQEFFIVLIATIFFTLLIVFITVVFGRIWCGWLCPQTVLVDFTHFVDTAKNKGAAQKIAAYVLTFVVSIVVAASLIWYFISPYEFIPRFLEGDLGATTWGFWIVLTTIIFLNYALLRQKWCATVCPYAKMQSVLFDKSTLIIELDPQRADECIHCNNCEKVCPTGIDVRKGMDVACINCAECIDACNKVMARSGRKGLVHYAFGSGGEGKVLRQNFFIAGGFVVLFLVLYVYMALTWIGVDVAVLPHGMEARTTSDGRIINAYVLAIKNMRDEQVDLTVTAGKFDETLVQSITAPLHLKAGEMDKYPLFLWVRESPRIKGTKRISIEVDDIAKKIHITKEANFVVPDKL